MVVATPSNFFLYLPGDNIGLAVWLQFEIAYFGGGLTPKSALLWARNPHLT